MKKKDLQIMKKAEQNVESKSAELIQEFYAHMEEYTILHPNDKDRKDEIFHGWIIQKIAGIQLSIYHTSERINNFIEKHEQEK